MEFKIYVCLCERRNENEFKIQEFSLTGLNGLGNSKNLHLHSLLLLLLKADKSGIF